MKTLIVAASKLEIRPLLHYFDLDYKRSGEIQTIKRTDIEVDILVSGIGMVPTSYYLTKVLSHKKYDLVINAGIAGSYVDSYPIGSVVQIVEDRFADCGIDDNGKFVSLFEAGFMQPDEFPFVNSRLIPKISKFDYICSRFSKAKAITVNTTSGSLARINEMVAKYKPDTESMEGAAFFYVCISECVPCLQIRAISNFVEPRCKQKWDITFAINTLNSNLICIFELLR